MSDAERPFFPPDAMEPGSRGDIPGVALAFARHGIPVVPCRDRTETWTNDLGETETRKPKSPKSRHGFKDATTNLDQVAAWWKGRSWMIGIPTGEPSGAWILDVDVPKKDGQPDGRETVARLEEENGEKLPATPLVETPSGGRHYYFRWSRYLDGVLSTDARILPGLDVRCRGGQAIGPWSVNAEKGRPYVLLSDPSTPLADAPLWLIDALRKERRGPSEQERTAVSVFSSGRGLGTGDWDPLARRDYEDALREVGAAEEGDRNPTLYKAAYWVFRKVRLEKIPESALGEIWGSFADAAAGRGLGKSEIRGTLESAWKGSGEKPFSDAELRGVERRREWRERMESRARRGSRFAESPPPDFVDVPPEAYEDDLGPIPEEEGFAAPAPQETAALTKDLRRREMDGVEALRNPDPVVVVPTPEEAAAFRADGVPAVALGDLENVGSLVLAAQRARRAAPLVFNEDESDFCRALTAALERNGSVSFVRGQLYPEGVAAETGAQGRLRNAVRALTAPWSAKRRAAYCAEYSAGFGLDEWMEGILRGGGETPISTGLASLDSLLGGGVDGDTVGGLYRGLYVLGSVPSNGKTTLALQIADYIAAHGSDALFFSYEMEKNDLRARSISRGTFLLLQRRRDRNRETDGAALAALLKAFPDYPEERIAALRRMAAARDPSVYMTTERGVVRGDLYREAYSAERKILLDAAYNFYKTFSGRVFIVKCGRPFGIEAIREAVERHIAVMDRVPVVFVDYIQNVAASDPRMTDKMKVDEIVGGLQEISRDFKATVFGVSSLNRAAYNTPVSMDSFKESGGVEFSADVLLGLQLSGVGKTGFSPEDAKREFPRRVDLVSLKNRKGATGVCSLLYYAPFNCFAERG